MVMQAESSTESARRSSAVLFDNPAFSAQASPERASTADSGLRRSRQGAAAGGLACCSLLCMLISCDSSELAQGPLPPFHQPWQAGLPALSHASWLLSVTARVWYPDARLSRATRQLGQTAYDIADESSFFCPHPVPPHEDDMQWICRTVNSIVAAAPGCRQLLTSCIAAASSSGFKGLPRHLPAMTHLTQLTRSDACAGEALPQGMTVYSNAVHGLSASTSGQGSSAAGPLEMSLPRMERETMSLPPGVQASSLSISLPLVEGYHLNRKGEDSLSIMSLPHFDWG